MRFQEIGSNTVFSNAPVVDYGDVLILSVKPQVVPMVLPDLKNYRKLLLSIAMGIPLASLEKVKFIFSHCQTFNNINKLNKNQFLSFSFF